MGRLDDRSVDPDGARLAPDGRRIEQARRSEMVGIQEVHRLLGHQDLARPGERGNAGCGVGRVAENLAILFDHRPDADAHLDRDRGAAVRVLHIDGGLVGGVRRRKGAHHAIGVPVRRPPKSRVVSTIVRIDHAVRRCASASPLSS